jgi:DNA-directed RNA polymerase subunit RPC12/RpoP
MKHISGWVHIPVLKFQPLLEVYFRQFHAVLSSLNKNCVSNFWSSYSCPVTFNNNFNNNPFPRISMLSATYSCNGCKAKFQVINISSTTTNPKFCPYCSKDAIEPASITLC